MEFRFVAPIASAAAATPLGRLQPETARVSARPTTRAVMVRIETPCREARQARQTEYRRAAILQLRCAYRYRGETAGPPETVGRKSRAWSLAHSRNVAADAPVSAATVEVTNAGRPTAAA